MRKVVLLLAVVSLLGAGGVAEAEPSDACASGELPPSATPAEVGARQAGDPYQEPVSLYVCNRGDVAPGQVWVRADTTQKRAHVIADGDSTNAALGCTDGYAAARVDGSGAVHLYRAGDGNFSFIAPERTPEQFASGALADCTA